MCGICGMISLSSTEDLVSIVSSMNNALLHRGPDDSGQFSSEMCSIAMRRLSIIDLAGGHQPMSNENETLHIVFNGEIYNYKELQQTLNASGRHEIKTYSDTEVILHLYEEYKEATPGLLKGMFAFCIHDCARNNLFLARDRFGEKPLYYSVVNKSLAFSSELASLLQWNAIQRKIDLEALFYYLYTGDLPAPLTMFAHIRQLPPGHWLYWEKGSLRQYPYYVPAYESDPNLNNEEVAKEAIRNSILCAVKRQMMSDVPLGALLSGGIDSSAIVAAMQLQSSRPVKTFTVRFEYAPYDESAIARQVAEHLGTDHHEFVITNGGFEGDDLWRIISHVGQPFSDSSAIPTYFVSKHVRDHVTVCLSGDGGDEMFAGYDYFRWSLNVDRLATMFPRPVLKLAHNTFQNCSDLPFLRRMGIVRKARRATQLASLPADERIWKLGTLFEHSELEKLVSPPLLYQWRCIDGALLADILDSTRSAPRLRQLMSYRLRHGLPEDMLVKVDRMSMAVSLEVRAPMLDADLAALSMRLPHQLLIRNGVTKYILRKAVRDWLPDAVFAHPKTGFSIPLHIFQNDNYYRLCQELILSNDLGIMNDLFSKNALDRVVQRGIARKSDAADLSVYRATHQLWALLQLAAWIQFFKVTL